MINMGYTTHQEDLAQVSEKLLHALSLPVGEISIKISVMAWTWQTTCHIIVARHPLSLLSMLFRQHSGITCSLATVAPLQVIILSLNQPLASPSYGTRERVAAVGVWGAGGSLAGLRDKRKHKATSTIRISCSSGLSVAWKCGLGPGLQFYCMSRCIQCLKG